MNGFLSNRYLPQQLLWPSWRLGRDCRRGLDHSALPFLAQVYSLRAKTRRDFYRVNVLLLTGIIIIFLFVFLVVLFRSLTTLGFHIHSHSFGIFIMELWDFTFMVSARTPSLRSVSLDARVRYSTRRLLT